MFKALYLGPGIYARDRNELTSSQCENPDADDERVDIYFRVLSRGVLDEAFVLDLNVSVTWILERSNLYFFFATVNLRANHLRVKLERRLNVETWSIGMHLRTYHRHYDCMLWIITLFLQSSSSYSKWMYDLCITWSDKIQWSLQIKMKEHALTNPCQCILFFERFLDEKKKTEVR
jgi:hypothetical protein